MNYREQIERINQRLAALETELDTADAARIAEIEEETRSAKAEREGITTKMREAAQAAFGRGTEVPAPQAESDNGISKMSKRGKIALVLGRQARGKAFSEVERRALGTAVATTAATFVEATAEADGVNNAGVLVSTKLVFDLLREEGKISPLFADINFTAIPGLTEFPFRATRDKARAKAEKASGLDNQMKWDKLQLSKGYLQTIIPVTDEIKALTDFDFGEYIVAQILQDINEDWAEDLIYGTGANDHVKGLTIGATEAMANGYAAGKVIDAIIAGIKLCKGSYRRNAKLYVAQDVADEILFSVDDNGNFRYPLFNNSTGITSFGALRVEVDENLKTGEFVIGDVNKYFKVNTLIPLRMETDRDARRGITEYIASVYCAAAPHAGAFIHGTPAQ